MNLINYFIQQKGQILELLIQHMNLTLISVFFAVILGIPIGILVCSVKSLEKPIIGTANTIQAIPSIALLGFAIPFFGIGSLPAVIAVTLYSLLPIIKNTSTGINGINPQTLEAAHGIGLNSFQVLTKVQIPLALPFIMAGVRIAAVTAVGLMTMAAFVGAGGLGYLVFSGIRTVNNYQILAGAIPACMLALAVDYFAAQIESMVVPKQSRANSTKLKKYILIATGSVILFGLIINAISGIDRSNERHLVIGSKDYTEQHIIANMVADLIEDKTDIKVRRRINLGGTNVCFGALRKGDIDMYIEYTGTIYGDILKYPPISDTQKVYDTSKNDFKEKFNIIVLDQMRFNNTYTLATTQQIADKYGLSKISDLRFVANELRLAATLEFLNRADGLAGLESAYGFNFRSSVGIDSSPRYLALDNDEVEIIDAFATDGLLKKFNLVVLEDDKEFFPPYYAIPIISEEAYKEFPEIIDILKELGQTLTNEVMTDLNYKVDELHLEPHDVAKEFLIERGIIKE